MGVLTCIIRGFPPITAKLNIFDGPLNTKYDDFALTIPPDAEFGYLTSNRPGDRR